MSILSENNAGIGINLRQLADYTKPGVTRKAIVKNERNRISLLCLTAGTEISEHTAPHDISIAVIEGHGVFTLERCEITLQPGVFIYVPAMTPHALCASENLALLLN